MSTMYDARPETEPRELDLDELAEVTAKGILDRFWEFADDEEVEDAFLGYFMLTDPLHAKQLEIICEELGLKQHNGHELILVPSVLTESPVFVEAASNRHDGVPCDVTLQLRSTDQVDLA